MAAAAPSRPDGETPLQELVSAIEAGQTDRVMSLLTRGLDVLAPVDETGRSAVYYALKAHGTGVEVHVDNRGRVRPVKGSGQPKEIARLVLDQIPDGRVDDRLYWGESPLHMAMQNGRVDLVEQLAGMGASFAVKSIYGDTPLTAGLKSTDFYEHGVELLRIALDAGVKPSHVDLVAAMRHRNASTELLEMLIDSGADFVPDDGVIYVTHHPIYWVSIEGPVGIGIAKKLLLSDRFRRGHQLEGVTMLVYFTRYMNGLRKEHVDFFNWLLAAGFSPRERCTNGLDFFQWHGYVGMTESMRVLYDLATRWVEGTHPIQLEQQAVAASLTNLPVELAGMVGDFVAMTQERRAAEKRQSE